MTAVPNTVALATIADGSLEVAVDHRNNYAAIQTAVNGLIAALSGGSAGQVLEALSSSSVDWNGGVYSAYTPTWTSTGVAPALGNGTIVGAFTRMGKFVQGSITLTMGSTTTFGTGAYILSLPVLCVYTANVPVGSAFIVDASPSQGFVHTPVVGGGGIILESEAAPTVPLGAAAPITFAVSDIINVNFIYQAA